jgi:serine/threonine protein kinase
MAAIGPGQRFGQWVTTGPKPLGSGGNGEVWRARSDDGTTGAIKLLGHGGRPSRYRLNRFRDEVQFLLTHPEVPGILPVLDSCISDDPGQQSWYVMPEAVPIREALGDDPAPGIVVAAVAEIAGTLSALAAEGVGHRDIKPDNLFRLGDRWVVGDFGLVTYPEKNPLTEHGRKLGPLDYLAPEMRENADTADPGPADVWALAKTLWVLLAGQQLPLPGTHRHAEPAHALQQRISFTFAAELDLLLEHATQIEPQSRPSMADMTRELRACTAQPPEASRPANLEQLRARAAALTAADRQNVSDAQARRDSLDTAWRDLQQVITDTGSELAGLLNFDMRGSESGYRASAKLPRPPFSPHDGRDLGCLLLPPGQPRPAVEVTVAAAMRVMRAGDPADIAVTLEVHHLLENGSRHQINEIWARTYDRIPLASAQLAVVIAEVNASLTAGFGETLRATIAILAAHQHAGADI